MSTPLPSPLPCCRIFFGIPVKVATANTYAQMFSNLPSCGKPTRLLVYDLHTLQVWCGGTKIQPTDRKRGVVWCGVVWYGVVCCGVVWYGAVLGGAVSWLVVSCSVV